MEKLQSGMVVRHLELEYPQGPAGIPVAPWPRGPG